MNILINYNLSLVLLKLKRSVKNPYSESLIAPKLRRCVKKLFLNKAVFMLKCCLDKYKNQGMCEKAVNDYHSTSRFVPDWLSTPKIFKELVYNGSPVKNINNARHTKKYRERYGIAISIKMMGLR